MQRFVIECKVLRDADRKSLAGTIERGVEQTLGYMARCGVAEGHLVVIDRHAEEHRRGDGAAGRAPAGRPQGGLDAVAWPGATSALSLRGAETRAREAAAARAGQPVSEAIRRAPR